MPASTKFALQDIEMEFHRGEVDAVYLISFASDNQLREFERCCLQYLLVNCEQVSFSCFKGDTNCMCANIHDLQLIDKLLAALLIRI